MSRRVVAAIVAAAYLIQLTGCTYRINSVEPNQLREPGFDVIKGVTTNAGEIVLFDETPLTRMARVVGDTLYAFVDGESWRITLDDVELINVERVHLVLPVKETKNALKALKKMVIKLGSMAEVLVPYIIPVLFLIIVVHMEKG